jgi:hypothetical protein
VYSVGLIVIEVGVKDFMKGGQEFVVESRTSKTLRISPVSISVIVGKSYINVFIN